MVNDQYWLELRQITDVNKLLIQNDAKFQIIEKLFHSLNIRPRTIVFAGFSPLVLTLEKHYACVVVADAQLKDIWQSKSIFIDNITDLTQPADVCLALDEYLTYADSEQAQRTLLEDLKKACKGYLITTLQDYKNDTPHKKASVEGIISNEDQDFLIIEQNKIDKVNRQSWRNYIFVIENHAQLKVIGPVERRTMYFKQLAKYSSDIGGVDYVIQKNLFYKGYYKKNYEHIITLRFL